jgi:cellulose synthase/poly-beta-1,6-N-acetylglucosamine synthase-like glycosyltransferase
MSVLSDNSQISSKCFFMVLARDAKNVPQKIIELQNLSIPFIIVCGEKVNHPNVVYRETKGKWDAINFGAHFIPDNAEIILFNDVDTKIHNIDLALYCIETKADMVYCRVSVSEGPQITFYRILNPIRQRFHVCASGEFMLVKRKVFDEVMPVPPCIAEDSYILFRAIELGFKAYFCTESYVTTKRTSNNKDEEAYKARTTLGIYQALSYSKPSLIIRVFYYLLPAFSPLLILAGGNGVAWAKGIRRAVKANVSKQQVTKF